ncbi:MAG TPA: LamG domain-containing protein, partial [Elusimicrobiota bacterium]|nr:LamG domain-containing protein [Elusimicrobiota bacterium]
FNLFADVPGLAVNTLYYGRVSATGNSGRRSPFLLLGSTSTLASQPLAGSGFSSVYLSYLTVSFANGSPANPAGTVYDVQLSQDPAYSSFIDSRTYNLSATFTGLQEGALYYARAAALDLEGVETAFTALGSVSTLSSNPVYTSPQVSTNSTGAPWIPIAGWVSSNTVDARVSATDAISGLLVSTTQPAGLAAQWHLDESGGTLALDASGNGDAGVLVGAPSWVAGRDGLALSLNGSTQYFYGLNSVVNPTVFTLELWFKTTTVTGGRLIGFGNAQTGSSTSYDRHIYMTNGGQLYFGVYPGSVQTINTSASYNDGNWHHVAATLSGAGMALYVDGALAASNAAVTTAQSYTGWWRVGDDNLNSWTNVPSSAFFNGVVDEVRVYTTALSAAQISADYSADTLAAQNQGQAYSVLFSSTAGTTWSYAATSSVTLSGTNGTTSAQTFQADALPFASSTGTDSGINQVEFVSQGTDGSVTETGYAVQADTTPPPAPSFSSLTGPATGGLTLNGLSGSDALSGLAAAPFDVQASTDPAFGVVNVDAGWSAGPAVSLAGLNPNTTYYARALAQDAAGNVSAASGSQALATLALAPGGTTFVDVSFTSASYAWTVRPVLPSSFSAEGYRLDVSSAPDFSGTVLSSSSLAVAQSTLAVSGLDLTTTEYFRVAALNWAGVPNYAAASPLDLELLVSTTILSFGTITPSVATSSVSVSSIVVTNVGDVPATVTLWGAVTTSPPSPWTLAVSSGIEQAVLQGLWNSVRPPSAGFSSAVLASTTTSGGGGGVYAGDQNGQAVPAGATRVIWFQLWLPTSSAAAPYQTLRVDMRPVYP